MYFDIQKCSVAPCQMDPIILSALSTMVSVVIRQGGERDVGGLILCLHYHLPILQLFLSSIMTWKLWKVLSCQDASTTVMPCGASVSPLEMESSFLSCGVWWETHFHSSHRDDSDSSPATREHPHAPAISKIAAGKRAAPHTPNLYFIYSFFFLLWKLYIERRKGSFIYHCF